MGWCQNSFARPLRKFLKSTFQHVLYGDRKLKTMLMFLRGFCQCSCLILAAACASASFLPLASPTPRFHVNSITSDTKCTFPVRPEYVPSTFRWLLFLDIFCSTELVWSAFLSVLSAALLSINVRPWPGLCPPPFSCTFHSAFHISNSTFRYVLYGGRTQK